MRNAVRARLGQQEIDIAGRRAFRACWPAGFTVAVWPADEEKIMGNMTLFIAGIAILSLGTYLMRLGGAKLGSRLAFSERSQALLSDAATVLLFSVALATTFYEGEHFAGMARVLGVA